MSFLGALAKIANGALESAAQYHQQDPKAARRRAAKQAKASEGCLPCQANAAVHKTREWVRVNYFGGHGAK